MSCALELKGAQTSAVASAMLKRKVRVSSFRSSKQKLERGFSLKALLIVRRTSVNGNEPGEDHISFKCSIEKSRAVTSTYL